MNWLSIYFWFNDKLTLYCPFSCFTTNNTIPNTTKMRYIFFYRSFLVPFGDWVILINFNFHPPNFIFYYILLFLFSRSLTDDLFKLFVWSEIKKKQNETMSAAVPFYIECNNNNTLHTNYLAILTFIGTLFRNRD